MILKIMNFSPIQTKKTIMKAFQYLTGGDIENHEPFHNDGSNDFKNNNEQPARERNDDYYGEMMTEILTKTTAADINVKIINICGFRKFFSRPRF